MKKDRIGEKNVNKQGLSMTIIDYRSADDIDILFEDGIIYKNRTYADFKIGKVFNKNYKKFRPQKTDRVGETFINSQGLNVTIIEYRSSKDIDIKFDDGYILRNKSYQKLKNGCYKNPNYKIGRTRERNEYNEYKRKYGILLNPKLGIRSIDIIDWYKYLINGTPNGKKLTQIPQTFINVDELPILFRYVIEEVIGLRTRDEFLTLTQPILEKHKISFSKTSFIKNSPYNVLNLSYPHLNIEGWEMTRVPTDYWKDYGNFKHVFTVYMDKLSKIEDCDYDYYISDIGTSKTFSKLFYAKKAIYDHKTWQDILYDCGYDIELKNDKVAYDGKVMNSKSEVYLYNFVNNILNIKLNYIGMRKLKGFYFKNEKYNENYIPDFYIKDDKPIIIEYFGMYNPNNTHPIFREYYAKTKRKIEYFNSLDSVYFIPLFPEDLNNDFKGVSDKLASFCMSKNIDLKGGVIDGK